MKDKKVFKTTELKGSNHVKQPMTSSTKSNCENEEIHCFLWSILSNLHPCENRLSKSVSNYTLYFNDSDIDRFEFSNGIRYNYVHRIEKGFTKTQTNM